MIVHPRPMKEGKCRQSCTCSMHTVPHTHVAPIDISRWPGETEDTSIQPRQPRKPRPAKGG